MDLAGAELQQGPTSQATATLAQLSLRTELGEARESSPSAGVGKGA
jgi:hypothetical protein